jgi:hypothetical protein
VGISIGAFTSPLVGYSASLPWIRAEANIDLVDNVTKTHGNHTFTFGFDMRRIRDDLLQTQTYSPRGVYTFRHRPNELRGQLPSRQRHHELGDHPEPHHLMGQRLWRASCWTAPGNPAPAATSVARSRLTGLGTSSLTPAIQMAGQ